jgi:hypothetical protein
MNERGRSRAAPDQVVKAARQNGFAGLDHGSTAATRQWRSERPRGRAARFRDTEGNDRWGRLAIQNFQTGLTSSDVVHDVANSIRHNSGQGVPQSVQESLVYKLDNMHSKIHKGFEVIEF